MNLKINWDALGITASVACAIHCAVLPLFLTSLPVLGFEVIDNLAFEYGMIMLAFIIGTYSLFHGFKKHHHSKVPLLVFSAGMALLLAKQRWHHYQLWLLIPAVILVVVAHYINYKLCRKANHCHVHDCAH